MNSDSNLSSEILAVRERGGFLLFDDFSLIEVAGKDACSYLQGRTSNDVKLLQPGQGQASSFLDRKGYIIALLSVHRMEDRYYLLSDRAQASTILKELNTYHFREQVSFADLTASFSLVLLQGALAQSFLLKSSTAVSEAENSCFAGTLFGSDCKVIRKSFCGDSGYFIFAPAGQRDSFLGKLEQSAHDFGIEKIGEEALDVLRVEAGIPKFGVDVSSEHLLPETGLEQNAASYNKGCFQGQEVLARIKTYGAPKRALVGLEFDVAPESSLSCDSVFKIKGEEAGVIKSSCFSPSLQKYIALAYIARDYRLPDHKVSLECEGKEYQAQVKFLPFYTASESRSRAQEIYKVALQEFAYGSEEKSTALLRQVLELDPMLIDAYESLGVILSRHEQLDEAIALMHRLMELDPNSVMAHTNLSIYYMQQGEIEKAEEEKAIAMSIRMAQLAKEAVAQKKQEEDKAKLAEEAERRLDMFRQVLAIDANDLLANNGIGTIYVELGKYEESLPYLHKAIQVKPTHTVAYVALGKAYESLERVSDAVRVYNAGIEVAAKRGDITPMKEMQGLLAALASKTGSSQ